MTKRIKCQNDVSYAWSETFIAQPASQTNNNTWIGEFLIILHSQGKQSVKTELHHYTICKILSRYIIKYDQAFKVCRTFY